MRRDEADGSDAAEAVPAQRTTRFLSFSKSECGSDNDGDLAASGDDDRDGQDRDDKANGATGRAWAGTARRDLDVGRHGEGRERPSKDGSRSSCDDALRPAARSPDRVHGGGKE